MANERTLAKPLSGLEVIEAIVSTVRTQLQKDCFLAPHMAYPSYSFTAKIDIQFQGSRIAGTTAHVKDAAGERVPNLPETTESVELSESPKPPNEVRRDTNQGVPVQVKTPSGRLEEKKVRYARPKGKTQPAA
jgi:hypothetical protein